MGKDSIIDQFKRKQKKNTPKEPLREKISKAKAFIKEQQKRSLERKEKRLKRMEKQAKTLRRERRARSTIQRERNRLDKLQGLDDGLL